MRLSDIPERYRGCDQEILNTAARKTAHFMESITPVGDTGILKNSIGFSTLGRYSRKIGSKDSRKYPRIMLLDIKPFMILPKRKDAMKWTGPQGELFANNVIHPGGRSIIKKSDRWLKREFPAIADSVILRR